MKCPKCRITMIDIRTPNGMYWHCNNCNADVGKPSGIQPKEEITEEKEQE